MKKNIRVYLIAVLVVENIILLGLADVHRQQKIHAESLVENQGVTQACNSLRISEDFSTVLTDMKGFTPTVSKLSGDVYLRYGHEWSDGPGVGLLFDSNFKLSHKACNSAWEPALVGIEVVNIKK